MALSRRSGSRFQANTWPGFVDAMASLLLVLMFLLTIFMVVQFVLREQIQGQETELNSLSDEIEALANALGLEERRSNQLEARMGALNATLGQTQTDLDAAHAEISRQSRLIDTLTGESQRSKEALRQAQTQITDFEAQVATLLASRDNALAEVDDLERQQAAAKENIAGLEKERGELLSERDALNAALTGLTADRWADLPAALARGDWSMLDDWSPARQLDVLQKLCHDLMAVAAGGTPRFFEAAKLPPPPRLGVLVRWSKSLAQAARSVEHPYNAGLMREAWVASTRQVLARGAGRA